MINMQCTIIIVIALLLGSTAMGSTSTNPQQMAGAMSIAQSPNVERSTFQDNSAEQVVRKLERQLADAYLRSDTAFLNHILADDYMVTDGPGTTSNKAKVLTDYKTGALKVESFNFNEMNVRIYGNTAVVTGYYTWKAQYKGRAIAGPFRYTRVYVNQQQGWQIVTGQVTPVQQQ